MDRWEIALLAIAAYVAVTTLVRLMLGRREQMLDTFRRQMHVAKQRKQAAEKQDRSRLPPRAA